GLDREDVAAHGFLHLHAVGSDLAIRRVVLAERKQRRVLIAGEALGGGDFGVDGHGAILSRPPVITPEAPWQSTGPGGSWSPRHSSGYCTLAPPRSELSDTCASLSGLRTA